MSINVLGVFLSNLFRDHVAVLYVVVINLSAHYKLDTIMVSVFVDFIRPEL